MADECEYITLSNSIVDLDLIKLTKIEMGEQFWPGPESSVVGLEDGGDAAFNLTVATSVGWKGAVPPAPEQQQSVSAKLVVAVGLVIASVGVVTNSAVLVVLVRARHQFGSSIHTLITNQRQL